MLKIKVFPLLILKLVRQLLPLSSICALLSRLNQPFFLGMCGGLRRRYKIGEYLIPVASVRSEGTSNFYFPPQTPSVANFFMQRAVTEVIEKDCGMHHIGITYTYQYSFLGI